MNKQIGEHFRIFPLSNWTELDVWSYILKENIPLPDLYFAKKRFIFNRDGVWLVKTDFVTVLDNEQKTLARKWVRFRTVGDATCTGIVFSQADTIEKIIEEIKITNLSERGERIDDKRSSTSMEDRKIKGYF